MKIHAVLGVLKHLIHAFLFDYQMVNYVIPCANRQEIKHIMCINEMLKNNLYKLNNNKKNNKKDYFLNILN
jgi:hypothetical protein